MPLAGRTVAVQLYGEPNPALSQALKDKDENHVHGAVK